MAEITVFSSTEIKILKRELKSAIKQCKQEDEMDAKSWGYQHGVLISGHDAEYILQLLNDKES